jgi:hypothetical protein
MPRRKVELFAATRQGSPFLPAPDRCRNLAETAAGSRDQRQDVFGSGSPPARATVRRTGEVAVEKYVGAPSIVRVRTRACGT